MPTSPGTSGSITQWIAVCKCDLIESDEGGDEAQYVAVCSNCGKRIETGRSGSLTQWIFRADICSCDKPESKLVLKELEAVKDLSDEEVDYFDEESVLDLEEDAFPVERYAPFEILGKGATGSVFKCWDRQLKKTVAVKTLHVLSDELLILFQNEAKSTSLLNHPGIVKVFDFGVSESGVPYMVLEYLDGISLEKQLSLGLPDDVETIIGTFVKICSVLDYSHSKGVYHRDLKPSNIILVNDDFGVRLIDFGIAVVTADSQGTTAAGGKTVIGTPAYMSPDQFAGLSFDTRSEVYSFGCLLFEALTGKKPFEGETLVETLGLHVNQPAPGLRDAAPGREYPEELEVIVSRCLEKEPDNRFQSFGELAESLKSIGVRKTEQESRPARTRKPFTVGIALFFSVVALAFAGVAIFQLFVTPARQAKKKDQTRSIEDTVLMRQTQTARDAHDTMYRIGDELYSFHSGDERKFVDGEKFARIKRSNNRAIYEAVDDTIIDADLKQFEGDKTLEILSLEGCTKVTGSGFKYLKDCPIKAIELEWCGITLEGIELLSQLETLDTVNLAHVYMSVPKIKLLGRLKNLRVLHLMDSRLNDSALKEVAKLKTVESLTISHNWMITYDGLKPLGKMPRLRYVSLTGNPSLIEPGKIKKLLPRCKFDFNFSTDKLPMNYPKPPSKD